MEAALSVRVDPLWVVPYSTVARDYQGMVEEDAAYVQVGASRGVTPTQGLFGGSPLLLSRPQGARSTPAKRHLPPVAHVVSVGSVDALLLRQQTDKCPNGGSGKGQHPPPV